jgi:hypothetical protein
MLSTVPKGVVRSGLHIGRCEGDAEWHRRSHFRIPPRETVVKIIITNVTTTTVRSRAADGCRPSRKSRVRGLRADAVKVRRPAPRGPQRGSRVGVGQRVGAKRRTLYGVEHSSTLRNVTAGPVRAPVRRSCRCGDIAKKPVVNADLIRQQTALVFWHEAPGQTAAQTRRVSSRHAVQIPTDKPWRERPSGRSDGPPLALQRGVAHATTASAVVIEASYRPAQNAARRAA